MFFHNSQLLLAAVCCSQPFTFVSAAAYVTDQSNDVDCSVLSLTLDRKRVLGRICSTSSWFCRRTRQHRTRQHAVQGECALEISIASVCARGRVSQR